MSINSSQEIHDSWFLRVLSQKAILSSMHSDGAASNTNGRARMTASDSPEHEAETADTAPGKHSSARQQPQDSRTYSSKKDDGKIETDVFNRELFRVRASRLVDIFPNELIIREKSISVIRRDFLISKVETWNIDDIGEITLTDAPLYSSLHVVGKFPEHKLDLHGIPKAKATQAKEILDGLVLEDQKEVDIPDDVDVQERRSMLGRAGKLPEGSGPV